MIRVRTAPSPRASSGQGFHDVARHRPAPSPTTWLRDPDAVRELTGLDGPWHLVSAEEHALLRQYHWSLARPRRTSVRWAEHGASHGAAWVGTLEQHPALFSATVSGPLPELAGGHDADAVLDGYDVVQRAHWTAAPAPLGLDLQLLTMDLDASTTVRLTYVNCFVDATRFDHAHKLLRDRVPFLAA